MNKYSIALIGLVVLAITLHWHDLSTLFETTQSLRVREFDIQRVGSYSKDELQMFLDHNSSMGPREITAISDMLHKKEVVDSTTEQVPNNCTLTNKNLSDALRDCQKDKNEYREQLKNIPISKWLNVALFLLFGGWAACLTHKKSYEPSEANFYDRRINLVSFVWALGASILGVVF